MADTGSRRTITVNVNLQGKTEGQSLPATRIYVFNQAGRLVGSNPAGKDVQFEVAANQNYRVTVGPDLLAKSEKPPANLAAQLAKSNAVSQDVLQQAAQNNMAIAVNPNIWVCWFPTCINVHGTVKKALPTGGTAPICVGVVQIFEVDLDCTPRQLHFFRFEFAEAKVDRQAERAGPDAAAGQLPVGFESGGSEDGFERARQHRCGRRPPRHPASPPPARSAPRLRSRKWPPRWPLSKGRRLRITWWPTRPFSSSSFAS